MLLFHPPSVCTRKCGKSPDGDRAADAQFSQALTHIRSGTPDAMAKAFDLFKRSGAHNFTEAQFAAGWCCEHGCGTKRNYPQAIRWYKRAENQRDFRCNERF